MPVGPRGQPRNRLAIKAVDMWTTTKQVDPHLHSTATTDWLIFIDLFDLPVVVVAGYWKTTPAHFATVRGELYVVQVTSECCHLALNGLCL